MYTAPALMLVTAALLYLAAWWYAHDGRALEAPYAPDVQPSTWAADLDTEMSTPNVGARRARKAAPRPRVLYGLGLAGGLGTPSNDVRRPRRHGTHLAAIPTG